MGPRFDETIRGRKFYESQLPKLIKAIEDNAAELKRANDLKEIELFEQYGIKIIKAGADNGSKW